MSVIDALYRQSCDVVRAPGSGTLEAWIERTGLAKGTIQKIRNGDETHRAQSKLQIIDAILGDEVGLQYALLAEGMGMRDDEHITLRRYRGEFTYVRNGLDGNVTSGKVMIRDKVNHVQFDHIPEFDSDLNPNSEKLSLHSGFVFLLGRRLTFWGVGDRYARMMTAIDHDTPSDNVLTGIVLTPDGDKKDPMASVFFMAHESYQHYSRFEEEYRETYIDKVQKAGCNEVLGLLTL